MRLTLLASRSTFTKPPRLDDWLFSAVSDLATAEPHQRTDASYTPVEWQIYSEGYYTAIVMALRVMDLAVDRWRLARRAHRAAAKQKRSA